MLMAQCVVKSSFKRSPGHPEPPLLQLVSQTPPRFDPSALRHHPEMINSPLSNIESPEYA